MWAVQRSLWLTYLSVLDLFWGLSAVSILWPGQRSSKLRRILRVGAIATALSGGALLAVLLIYDAEKTYIQLVGLILLSGIAAGYGQAWTDFGRHEEQASELRST